MPVEKAQLNEVTLAVLAGGEGSRMGGPKAWMELEGRPMLDYLMDRFAWPGPTMLVTAPGREHPPGAERFTLEMVDPVAGEGPLRGLLTALDHAPTPLMVVTTVDMPEVGVKQLSWMLEQLIARPQVPGVLSYRLTDASEMIEPFPSAFRYTAGDIVERKLANGGSRSVMSLVSIEGFAAVACPADWPESLWTNLNTPADAEEFVERRLAEAR